MNTNEIKPGVWANFFGQVVYVVSVDDGEASVIYCEHGRKLGTFRNTALVEDLVAL